MASQFTIFSSSDVAGPGLLTGAAGSLLAVLDACLVTSYAGHTLAAQWTKPIANAGNIGSYKQGAGAGLGLVVNDAGPNGTSTYKEAWAIGWESVAGVGSPVGTGSGQFPIPAQSLTSGHVVIRKSLTADATGRAWTLFADSSTFYLFVASGDTTNVYMAFMFGDVFSLKGATDAYRCMIHGRAAENSGGGSSTVDTCDLLYPCAVGGGNGPGMFVARSYGGGGTSITTQKMGDMDAIAAPANTGVSMAGAFQIPNGPDNSIYLSPLKVIELVAVSIRGRLRGIYQVCHPLASFANGQTFVGGGDFAGKAFQIVSAGPNSGFWALETSATVETN